MVACNRDMAQELGITCIQAFKMDATKAASAGSATSYSTCEHSTLNNSHASSTPSCSSRQEQGSTAPSRPHADSDLPPCKQHDSSDTVLPCAARFGDPASHRFQASTNNHIVQQPSNGQGQHTRQHPQAPNDGPAWQQVEQQQQAHSCQQQQRPEAPAMGQQQSPQQQQQQPQQEPQQYTQVHNPKKLLRIQQKLLVGPRKP